MGFSNRILRCKNPKQSMSVMGLGRVETLYRRIALPKPMTSGAKRFGKAGLPLRG
jgi:hypothetical protein